MTLCGGGGEPSPFGDSVGGGGVSLPLLVTVCGGGSLREDCEYAELALIVWTDIERFTEL